MNSNIFVQTIRELPDVYANTFGFEDRHKAPPEKIREFVSDEIKQALENGANPNCENDYGLTPFMAAIKWNRYGVAELMIKHGADINYLGSDGTPLFYVSVFPNVKMVKLLIKNGADPTIPCDGTTPYEGAKLIRLNNQHYSYFSHNWPPSDKKKYDEVLEQLEKIIPNEIKNLTEEEMLKRNHKYQSEQAINEEPFLKFIRNLNMTECYKIMLLQGNPEITKFLGKQEEEFLTLRADYFKRHPEVEEEIMQKKPTDCVII